MVVHVLVASMLIVPIIAAVLAFLLARLVLLIVPASPVLVAISITTPALLAVILRLTLILSSNALPVCFHV